MDVTKGSTGSPDPFDGAAMIAFRLTHLADAIQRHEFTIAGLVAEAVAHEVPLDGLRDYMDLGIAGFDPLIEEAGSLIKALHAIARSAPGRDAGPKDATRDESGEAWLRDQLRDLGEAQ